MEPVLLFKDVSSKEDFLSYVRSNPDVVEKQPYDGRWDHKESDLAKRDLIFSSKAKTFYEQWKEHE
jgi:hypothetical protein